MLEAGSCWWPRAARLLAGFLDRRFHLIVSRAKRTSQLFNNRRPLGERNAFSGTFDRDNPSRVKGSVASRLGIISLSILFGGCGAPVQDAPRVPLSGQSDSIHNASTTEDARHETTERTETWDAVFVDETKIGHTHTVTRSLDQETEADVQIQSTTVLRMARFGQEIQLHMDVTSNETTNGAVRSFRCRTVAGPSPILIEGQYEDGRLVMETESQGQRSARTIAWSDSNGGFFAIEQSLHAEPMQPGDDRELRLLIPGLVGVHAGTAKLRAERHEPTQLLDGQQRLLRIQVTVQFANQPIETVYWTDEAGETLKSHIAVLDQTTYRTSRQRALAASTAGDFDLGQDLIVPVATPLTRPHRTQSVVYRVKLERGDPSRAFASGAGQRVSRISDHEAEVVVQAIRPETPAKVTVATLPTEAELAANNLIQSDDPRIRQLAAEIAASHEDRWRICQAAERWVHEQVRVKNFSHGFATAADVMRTREGDCTEHAVLLAALCRAREIPARVVVGLVYSPRDQGFAFHMWNEVWVNDRWVPLDATLGLGGIGAAHLRLKHSALSMDDAEEAILGVISVLKQLKIQVLEVSEQ